MKKVRIVFLGNSTTEHDDDYAILDKLIDGLWINMERVPCRGEGVNLFIENYHVFFEVKQVYTTLDLTSEEHYERYRIVADNAEIVEEFKKKED